MSTKPFSFNLTQELAGKRLDSIIANLLPDYSRSLISDAIKKGEAYIDGVQVKKPNQKVKGYEHVLITLTREVTLGIHADSTIKLNVVYEDNDILIINKPINLVAHPGAGNPDKTLANAVLAHAPCTEQLPRAGLVHRLDKDTSGLMIMAKTEASYQTLVERLSQREISRHYLAIVHGDSLIPGTINTCMGRHPRNRLKMAVKDVGKTAITHYRPLEYFEKHIFVELTLETGRTHQIRVHMSHLHHPIVGDVLYGGYKPNQKVSLAALQTALNAFKHQALHAYKLKLNHPISHETLEFEAPLPQDYEYLLALLRQSYEHSFN